MKDITPRTIYENWIKSPIFLISVVFLGALYLGYLWDLSDLQSTIADLKKKENELKDQMTVVINKEAAIQNELAQFAVLKAQYAQWQKQIINYAALPELLNEILKTGGTDHLYFSLFNPGEASKEGSYLKVPIKVVVVGSYHQFANFLSHVANLPWIVSIGDFSISTENKSDMLGAKLAQEANAQKLLTTELNLEVYHAPEVKKP